MKRSVRLKYSMKGGTIVQETRLFNADTGVTASMRGKEDAHDYRYFPDPDLVPLVLEDSFIENIKENMPELPDSRKKRFINDYALPKYDADVLTAEKSYAEFFETALKTHNNPKD